VLFDRRPERREVQLYTAVGARRVALRKRTGADFALRVEIGQPDFYERRFFPFLQTGRIQYRRGKTVFYPVAVGNPHVVVLVAAADFGPRLLTLGKSLEAATIFPLRTNVEFCCVDTPDACRVLYYERGVGQTLASSTGSAAVYAVLRQLGKAADGLTIDTGPQGRVKVTGRSSIFVENRTTLVFRGQTA
jgi:diaminopimelate epimerase